MEMWLLKTEPEDFSYTDLEQAGTEIWDGVRAGKAQKYLRLMKPGDLTFIYHTGKERAVVGVAEVVQAAFPDPTGPDYAAVKVRARYPLPRPVSLKEIKALPVFSGWDLTRLPRLSVMPVTAAHWQEVHSLAGRKLTQT